MGEKEKFSAYMPASTRQPQYNYATSSWFTHDGPITCALLLLGMVDRLRSSASSELGPLSLASSELDPSSLTFPLLLLVVVPRQ